MDLVQRSWELQSSSWMQSMLQVLQSRQVCWYMTLVMESMSKMEPEWCTRVGQHLHISVWSLSMVQLVCNRLCIHVVCTQWY